MRAQAGYRWLHAREGAAQHSELLSDGPVPACSAAPARAAAAAVPSPCPPTGIYGPNPGLAKLLFAILFPVGLTMNTLHGTGVCRLWRLRTPSHSTLVLHRSRSHFAVLLCHSFQKTTELFTGNTMKLPAAIYEGKSTFGKLCHNWFWSYLGNFVGSLALVWMVVQSGVLAAAPGYAIKTAMAKGTLPWAQVRVILRV